MTLLNSLIQAAKSHRRNSVEQASAAPAHVPATPKLGKLSEVTESLSRSSSRSSNKSVRVDSSLTSSTQPFSGCENWLVYPAQDWNETRLRTPTQAHGAEPPATRNNEQPAPFAGVVPRRGKANSVSSGEYVLPQRPVSSALRQIELESTKKG
jgi:hypothetical protein